MIARIPRVGRLVALGSAPVVAALVAFVSVAGASASAGLGRGAVGPFGLPALRAQGQVGSAATEPGAPRSSVPRPGTDSELNGVRCVNASDCWAVGYYESNNATLNEALHFNGKKWSVVKTPDPGGMSSGDTNILHGLRCPSASDCWAVGRTYSGTATLNEALRWNGKKWSSVKTPDPAGNGSGDYQELFRVMCTRASDCWAVGDSTSGAGAAYLNQVLRWNGKKWSVVTTPDPGGTGSNDENVLLAVTCLARSDCWAVGDTKSGSSGPLNQALHWNGKKWSSSSTPDPHSYYNQLDAVACPSAADCWGVGFTAKSTAFYNEALHFNGKKWTHVKTPQPATTPSELGNALSAVDCISASACWAVGSYYNGSSVLNEAVRWNGHKWAHAKTPQPFGTHKALNALFGLSCPSASDCRAVGAGGLISPSSFSNEALHWNGTKWSKG